jgi:hypothetical protein
MVEEGERPVGGERREPQGQACELDSCRIDIDPEQAPLRDKTPNRRALARADVAGKAVSVRHERSLVGVGEIAAGPDEKRATPHRRIEHAPLENLFRCRVADKRDQRVAHQVVDQRLGRVEGPVALRTPDPGLNVTSSARPRAGLSTRGV